MPEHTCPQCLCRFVARRTQKYCSIACGLKASRKGQSTERTCPHCQGLFTAKPSSDQKYCSIACGVSATRKGVAKPHLWKRQPIPCPACGQTFKPLNWRIKFCSKTCAARTTSPKRETSRGWYRSSTGYILIRRPEHPKASKAGYVMQHRLTMEEHLGRPLKKDEVVHHRNSIRDDNRIENLELLTKQKHDRLPKGRMKRIVACPCCGKKLRLSNSVRTVELLSE